MIENTATTSDLFFRIESQTVFLMRKGDIANARCTCLGKGCVHVAEVAAFLAQAQPKPAVPAARPAARPAVAHPAPKPAPAETTNVSAAEAARQMKALVARMAADAGLDVAVEFRTRNGSYHKTVDLKQHRHLIVFGWASIDRAMKTGFREYKSLEWLLPNPRPAGLQGALWLAVHEFAHCTQCEQPGGRTYGSCHNATFVACYKAAIKRYL